jgi:hypothetical protein
VTISIGGSTGTLIDSPSSVTPSMPTHAAGDRLVLAMSWKHDTVKRTHTLPSGWTQDEYAEFTEGGSGGWYNVLVISKIAASSSESVTVNLSGTANCIDYHVWTLSGNSITKQTSASTHDTNNDTSYDVPGLTTGSVTGAAILSVATVAQGNHGLDTITSPTQDANRGGANQSWGPYVVQKTSWDLFTGTDPAATTGGITNGASNNLVGMRISYIEDPSQSLTIGLLNNASAAYAPTVNRQGDLALPLLNQTAAANAPTINRLAGINRIRHKTPNTIPWENYSGRTRPIEWHEPHTDDQGHELGPGLQYGWAPLDSGLLIPESYLPAALSDPIYGLFGTPDTAFEFDSSSLTGLTVMGSPDTEDANTTFASCYFVSDNDATLVGRYASVSPPFTVIAKIADAVLNANYKYAHLFVGVATPGKLVSIGPVYSDGSALNGRVWTSPSDGGPSVITPTNGSMFAGSAIFPLYLAARVASSTDASYYASKDGRRWWTIATSRNDSLTIASAGICVGAYASAPAQAAWDFLRIWNSTKTFPAFA